MIYPSEFPQDRMGEYAEAKVFEQLKLVSDRYDVFYSKRFVDSGDKGKSEYEIDFIIAQPERAVLCLEVKGGIVGYDGVSDRWSQNGRTMSKRPDAQATAASHSLARRYSEELSQMPVGWALCFPDCQVPPQSEFPTSVHPSQIIDEGSLLHIVKVLPDVFEFIKDQHPSREGGRRWQYDKFKKHLLRGLGFVQLLGTKIRYQEKRFVELTQQQLDIFNRVSSNKRLIVTGPAGSGKTIVAKTIAQDLINEGMKVLFLCFNRTLANKIRYEFDKREERITVSTFHSLARSVITEADEAWWKRNADSKSEDFWNLDVPVKMEECLTANSSKFDAVVIDEGQDFKELWFELIFQLVKPGGQRTILMDEMQNIFGHYTDVPESDSYIRYSLRENCRNTKRIVHHLSNLISKEIQSFPLSPDGAEVVHRHSKNAIEQQRFVLDEIKALTSEHGIAPEQILILLNGAKADSCLASTAKVGRYSLEWLDNKARFQRDAIHYSTINVFKGLEADVVFVLDIQQVPEEERIFKLYTQCSRARFKLYVCSAD
jgi:energy-coupling factor transporter ATP-binding protein EcfA2